MTNLRELDLRGNHIAELPDSIAMLTHLRRLELSRNPLMGLPAAMAQMTELRELVLWSTYVTELPPEMGQLDGSLELLDLRDCPMTQQDQEALEQMLPSVKKIWYYACNCE
jgi:internalin A